MHVLCTRITNFNCNPIKKCPHLNIMELCGIIWTKERVKSNQNENKKSMASPNFYCNPIIKCPDLKIMEPLWDYLDQRKSEKQPK